jgi:predicted RNA-binding protein YlqC (UPF0109 family)
MDIQRAQAAEADTSGAEIRTLIEEIARALVDHSDEVTIREIVGSTTTVYEVSVAKGDVGKIIGKSGRTLRAFRAILGAVATKYQRKAILEVLE